MLFLHRVSLRESKTSSQNLFAWVGVKQMSGCVDSAKTKTSTFRHELLGYKTLSSFTNSSFNVRGAVKRIMKFALPALSQVPLDLAPPNDCCPITAPVVLQLI